MKCRLCSKDRYAASVHVSRMTEMREISPYWWGQQLDEER